MGLIMSISLFTLQGCFFLAAAGAGAATTAAVVNEKRSIETLADDKNIEFNVNSRISQDPVFMNRTHIVVVSFNHGVLLVGQVPDQTVRTQVASRVESLPKVTRIYNQLEIASPTSPLIRSNDAWITAKIKAEFLKTKNLKSGQIKVVTENGSVYLLGIVSHYQEILASNVARNVNGVKRIVKLFEYTYKD